MKKTIRLLALVLVFAMLLCAGITASAAEETSDETLVVLVDAEPTHLMSTYTMFNRAGAHVAFVIYDTLIRYDYDTHEYVPAVAESWEWLDETHLQFNLRHDVIAADGTPFTADDVLFTCELGVNGGSQSYWNMIDLEEC